MFQYTPSEYRLNEKYSDQKLTLVAPLSFQWNILESTVLEWKRVFAMVRAIGKIWK